MAPPGAEPSIRFVFGVHSHQPIGNFDDVIETALRTAYDPFLDALERHPAIKAVLHYSGCLCEWLERRAPEHLDRIGRLARSGQIEVLGGGFYEPILALLPQADRVGQIRLQSAYIRERFGAPPRGLWLPERVWEPTLPSALNEAQMQYALLDDYHFLAALDRDPVGGSYLTEDQGSPVRLFPISEKLRYLIPFREPSETIDWLRELAGQAALAGESPVAVIVDDGEKFGLWPRTYDWVHGSQGASGWLERFLQALEDNATWLRTTTLAASLDEVAPRGRVYLPPGSYFEMGEWSLPASRGRAYAAAVAKSRREGDWEADKPFLRGGYFRTYQAKYSESLLMVRRVQIASARLDEDASEAVQARLGNPSAARRELWRATCNCAYWHGIFGGLYLPHIRRAVGEHLCRAGRLAETADSVTSCRAELIDADGDGHPEIEILTPHLGLLALPGRGGALEVLDLRRFDFPLGQTLTRRLEIYHEEMLRSEPEAGPAGGHGSIHEAGAHATDEMKAMVVEDDRPRGSLVGRFLDGSCRAADLAAGRPVEQGDHFSGRYEAELLPAGEAPAGRVGARMRRAGRVAGRPLAVVKLLRAGAEAPHLEVIHRLSGEPAGGVRFALELNLALIESRGRIVLPDAADSPGEALSLSEIHETAPVTSLRIEEGHAGFVLSLQLEPAAAVWHYPVRTVSRSEAGYEAIYQGSSILLVWGGDGAPPPETRLLMEVAPLDV